MSQPASIIGILREPTRTTESIESSARIVVAAGVGVAAPLGLLLFWGDSLPIAGRGSLGMAVALGAAVAAALAFVAGRLVLRRRFGAASAVDADTGGTRAPPARPAHPTTPGRDCTGSTWQPSRSPTR